MQVAKYTKKTIFTNKYFSRFHIRCQANIGDAKWENLDLMFQIKIKRCWDLPPARVYFLEILRLDKGLRLGNVSLGKVMLSSSFSKGHNFHEIWSSQRCYFETVSDTPIPEI